MKSKSGLFVILLFLSINLFAQSIPQIEVPDIIEFAGMKLTITSGAKEILLKDITSMRKNPKYFYSKVALANLYFPMIEKVFEEEGFPADFKYLALQESSLIADAISKSNAVGYWQFKKESAIEVGLRVDTKIDERMNIVSSSRGAARYLKRNNQTFNNWVYALLSYNLGLTGAKSEIILANIGAKDMVINEKMHWYVLRFLAHKLMYQNAIENAASVDSVLIAYIDGANKTLSDIAAEYKLDNTAVVFYNKWLKVEAIPEDKIYPVLLAVPMSQAVLFNTTPVSKNIEKKDFKIKKEKFSSAADVVLKNSSTEAYIYSINGTQAVLAKEGDNSVTLSVKGGISKEEFLEYNEMQSFDDVQPAKIYYLESKRKKAMVMFHTVQLGESLWDIAQNYGIKIGTIRAKNRMDENEAVSSGRVLWLRTKRPKSKPIEYKTVGVKEFVTLKNIASGVVHIVDSTLFTYTYHEVVAGETIFGISKKYQVATDSLMKWNNLDSYALKLKQKLIVGVKEHKQKEESFVHTVSNGDTFYKIAHQYSVSVLELLEWNNRTDLNLKLGDKVLIKKSDKVVK